MQSIDKGDIIDRRDIEALVDAFYDKVNEDPLLQPVFSHVDWVKHKPIMYNFWSSMMLGDESYKGNPFQKHLPLKIDASHFMRWLELFTVTVDEQFEGHGADEIKMRASSIAGVFQHKMGLLK